MSGVVIARDEPSLRGWCEDCPLRWTGAGSRDAENSRSVAKGHAKRTGHTVHVERSAVTHFNPKASS